jgi:hypothetical protein
LALVEGFYFGLGSLAYHGPDQLQLALAAGVDCGACIVARSLVDIGPFGCFIANVRMRVCDRVFQRREMFERVGSSEPSKWTT